MGTVTLETVALFGREAQQAEALRAEALQRRNDAMLEAVEGGQSQAAIAEALGVEPSRVSQILRRAREARAARRCEEGS